MPIQNIPNTIQKDYWDLFVYKHKLCGITISECAVARDKQ